MATIRIVRPNEDASRVIGTLGYWVNVLPPRQVKWAKALQFWLGANANFESWVLFGFPYDSEDVQPNASNALAWLEGATSKNIEFIGRALMEAYVASRNPGGISEIGLISVPAIPPTPSVEDVGSIFPPEWLPWPATLQVSFRLSEGQGVNADLFEEYGCKTIGEALGVVTRPRVPGLLIRYCLHAELDAVPLLPYMVDRPLRGGKKHAAVKRQKEDFVEMSMLYQHVARSVGFSGEPAYDDKHSVRLAVSGSSAEDAERNWGVVARGLNELARKNRT